MRKRIAIFLAFLLAFNPVIASAATLYVRDGCTGTGTDGVDGDWNTANCYDQLTTAEAQASRGDTIFVADGTYTGGTLDVAASGSTYITIKKAISTDHGTETGWDSAYGDGVAEFTSGWNIQTGYWKFDGQVGGGPDSWTSGHGFKVSHSGGGDGFSEAGGTDVDYVEISHVEIEGSGPDDDCDGCGNDGILLVDDSNDNDNWTIEYNYIHYQGRVPIYARNGDDFLIQYNYIEHNENCNSPDEHSEGISTGGSARMVNRWVVRWNVWNDIEGTGIIGLIGDDHEIYGNLIYHSSAFPRTGQQGGISNGAIFSWSTRPGVQNMVVANNTFVNITNDVGYDHGIRISNSTGTNAASGNVAYNNLFYNLGDNSYSGMSHSDHYGAYDSNDSTDTQAQTGLSSTIFTNYAGEDFTLASGTTAGYDTGTICPGNDVDMYGNARGADGTWDRGAFEYGTSGSVGFSAGGGSVGFSAGGGSVSFE